MNHFAVHLKIMQYYKSTILQFKKKQCKTHFSKAWLGVFFLYVLDSTSTN